MRRLNNYRPALRVPVKPWAKPRPARPAPNIDLRQRVYRAILDYAIEHGGSTPTLREIMAVTGITSTSVANYHVRALIDEERLEVRDRKLIVVGGMWIPPATDER